MPVHAHALRTGSHNNPHLCALPADYVIAVVQLVAANYMGQHYFLEEMSGMQSPSTFQHSTAWAQVGGSAWVCSPASAM